MDESIMDRWINRWMDLLFLYIAELCLDGHATFI